jgi:hypothetical protein
MNSVPVFALLLQGAPPEGLILAMVISYALGFAGMLLAYLNYRKRHRTAKRGPESSQGKREP